MAKVFLFEMFPRYVLGEAGLTNTAPFLEMRHHRLNLDPACLRLRMQIFFWRQPDHRALNTMHRSFFPVSFRRPISVSFTWLCLLTRATRSFGSQSARRIPIHAHTHIHERMPGCFIWKYHSNKLRRARAAPHKRSFSTRFVSGESTTAACSEIGRRHCRVLSQHRKPSSLTNRRGIFSRPI